MLNALRFALGTYMLSNFGPVTKSIHFNTLKSNSIICRSSLQLLLTYKKITIVNKMPRIWSQNLKPENWCTSKSSISSSAFQSGQIKGNDKLSCWKNISKMNLSQEKKLTKRGIGRNNSQEMYKNHKTLNEVDFTWD